MSYSEPFSRVTYSAFVEDFLAPPPYISFRAPNGRNGILRNIAVCITTTTGGDTNKPIINVGTTLEANKFASFELPAAAPGFAVNAVDVRGAIKDPVLTDDTIIGARFVPPAGANAGGGAYVYVIVEWQ